MPTWLPLDVIVLYSNAVLAALVLMVASRLAHPSAYLCLHLAIAAGVYLLARYDEAEPRAADPVTVLRYWLPAAFVLWVYFELGLLIPLLRDVSHLRYDYALQAMDVWLLGDPAATISRHAHAFVSDLLTLCYLAYYPFVLAVPVALYARGALADYQRACSVILVAFLLSYVGYVIWPAYGPHRVFDGTRVPALDGYGFARLGYRMLRGIPNEPPDAFPSGHALFGVLIPALAWRWERRLFLWLLPIGAGTALATVYLRLHYLADVAAALLLVPVAWQLGVAIERRFAVQSLQRSTYERTARGSPS